VHKSKKKNSADGKSDSVKAFVTGVLPNGASGHLTRTDSALTACPLYLVVKLANTTHSIERRSGAIR